MRNRLVRDCTRFTEREESLWTICRPPESADQLYSNMAVPFWKATDSRGCTVAVEPAAASCCSWTRHSGLTMILAFPYLKEAFKDL